MFVHLLNPLGLLRIPKCVFVLQRTLDTRIRSVFIHISNAMQSYLIRIFVRTINNGLVDKTIKMVAVNYGRFDFT